MMKMQEETDEFITDGKSFYSFFRVPLVSGYMPVPIPQGDPVLRWHGPRIDLETQWRPVLKFMVDYKKHEVVLRIFMSADRSRILIFPLTQIYGTGMSVAEDITQEERTWWAGQGLIEAGTIHSHCDAGAFQSGTDKRDEETRDGLHITVGYLNKNRFDIHSRMTWTIPGEEKDGKLIRASLCTTQVPDLSDWFNFPAHVAQFLTREPELERDIIRYLLTKPPDETAGYPPEWKDKLIQRPPTMAPMGTTHWGPTTSTMEDLPGFIKKKVENQKNDQNDPRVLHSPNIREMRIWDLWSEVMAIIADDPVLRSAKVSVSEFDPEKRPFLIKAIPQALEAWEAISALLKANSISEEEFFSYLGT